MRKYLVLLIILVGCSEPYSGGSQVDLGANFENAPENRGLNDLGGVGLGVEMPPPEPIFEENSAPPPPAATRAPLQALTAPQSLEGGGGAAPTYQAVVQNPLGESVPNALPPTGSGISVVEGSCFSRWMYERGYTKVWFAPDEVISSGQLYVCRVGGPAGIYWQKR